MKVPSQIVAAVITGIVSNPHKFQRTTAINTINKENVVVGIASKTKPVILVHNASRIKPITY